MSVCARACARVLLLEHMRNVVLLENVTEKYKFSRVTILSTIRICELEIKSQLLVHFWIRKLKKCYALTKEKLIKTGARKKRHDTNH